MAFWTPRKRHTSAVRAQALVAASLFSLTIALAFATVAAWTRQAEWHAGTAVGFLMLLILAAATLAPRTLKWIDPERWARHIRFGAKLQLERLASLRWLAKKAFTYDESEGVY